MRDLEIAGEMLAEVYTAQKDIGERISHVVLMGIGEPLDNYDRVLDFLAMLTSPGAQHRHAQHQLVHRYRAADRTPGRKAAADAFGCAPPTRSAAAR